MIRDKMIRHQICFSKSLGRCSKDADAWFHKFLLLADDWGCFEYDVEIIHSVLFTRRKKEISEEDVEKWLDEYNENGMLFRWRQGDKTYGFFVNHAEHNWIKSLKRFHKHKTPEPPKDAVKKYRDEMYEKFHNGKKPEEESKDDNVESPF